MAKGYLPISLVTPLKLQEILGLVKKALIKTNPEYDIVIKRLHLYYDMKLVTFGFDRRRNLIIQFPIFMQSYTQQPLTPYQLETVSVPIIDEETLYCIKFRNVHKHMTRVGHLQKNRV